MLFACLLTLFSHLSPLSCRRPSSGEPPARRRPFPDNHITTHKPIIPWLPPQPLPGLAQGPPRSEQRALVSPSTCRGTLASQTRRHCYPYPVSCTASTYIAHTPPPLVHHVVRGCATRTQSASRAASPPWLSCQSLPLPPLLCYGHLTKYTPKPGNLS